MEEKQLNRHYIQERLKDFKISSALTEQIRLLVSESYVDGLRQKEFDVDMDLRTQLQQYKQQIDDVRQELKNLLEFALYENYQYCNTEKHVERILSKLKERDEK